MIINLIISVDEKRFDSDNRFEDYQAYENLVKETVDYESLEVTHHDDMRQVDEIVNLIVETVRCKNDKILIASNSSVSEKSFPQSASPTLRYILPSFGCRSPLRRPHSDKISHKLRLAAHEKPFSDTL